MFCLPISSIYTAMTSLVNWDAKIDCGSNNFTCLIKTNSGLPFQICWTRLSHTALSCCFGNKWREYRSLTSRIHAACQCQNSASMSCPSKNLILVFQPCVALSWDITLIVFSQTAAKYPPNTWDNLYNQYFCAGLLNLGNILIVLF